MNPSPSEPPSRGTNGLFPGKIRFWTVKEDKGTEKLWWLHSQGQRRAGAEVRALPLRPLPKCQHLVPRRELGSTPARGGFLHRDHGGFSGQASWVFWSSVGRIFLPAQ